MIVLLPGFKEDSVCMSHCEYEIIFRESAEVIRRCTIGLEASPFG